MLKCPIELRRTAESSDNCEGLLLHFTVVIVVSLWLKPVASVVTCVSTKKLVSKMHVTI